MAPAIELLPYQKKWIEDKSRYKIGLWSRQTGKTFSATYEIVDNILELMVGGQRTTWIIMSAGERQAKEALDSCKRHCQAFQMGFEAIDEDSHLDGVTFKVQEIRFSNGSRIISLPANPATARGYSGNLMLDESCFWKDSDTIWQAVAPIATRGGFKVRMTSTPAGRSGVFYRLWTSENNWSKHQLTIHEAVAQGLQLDVAELEKSIGDPDIWRTEYLLEWADQASAWLSYDLINAVEHSDSGNPDGYQNNPVYVGLDLAMRNDLWVATVLEPIGDVLWCRELIARRRPSFAERESLIAGIFKRYRVARLCLDQTGMGEDVTQRYQQQYGGLRVEGVLFNPATKLVLANGIKEAFEDRKIRIPVDTDLREDLHKIKKLVTGTGAVRFDADSDSAGHSDRFWSMALAIQAASGKRPTEFVMGEPLGLAMAGFSDGKPRWQGWL